jgi:hypothetical protein
MRRRRAAAVAAFVAGLACGGRVSAQQLNLTITPASFTFPSADPDLSPVVAAQSLTVLYRVRQNAQGNWLLTVRADGDLTAGAETIPISNVTWIGTPAPPFQNGTMSRSVEQPVASGSGNVAAERTGSLTFHLVNSWNYSAGLYTQTFVFTLTAP